MIAKELLSVKFYAILTYRIKKKNFFNYENILLKIIYFFNLKKYMNLFHKYLFIMHQVLSTHWKYTRWYRSM